MSRMRLDVFNKVKACASPSFSTPVIPVTSCSYVFDNVLIFERSTNVSAGGLTITKDRRKPKNPVKRLIAFCREEDCRAKPSDIGRKMNQEVKFGLCDQNHWSTLSR